MIELKDQNVLVLGLGVSGLAMALWCVRQGALVTVADTRANPPYLTELQTRAPQANFICGAFDTSLLAGRIYGAIFKSPGLSPASCASFFVADAGQNTRLNGELDLFVSALGDLKTLQGYSPAVIAITGTNGKTTVTALTGQLIERCGKSVAVAGNIGPSLLDTLADRLDRNQLPEVWVLELSSFQLEGVEVFEPTAAAVLNISQDHLDWHGTMQDYIAAKSRVGLAMKAGMPILKEGTVILIKKGYHPLLYLKNRALGRKTVPFDLRLHPENHILVLSGPNAGGKSVVMKSVGLLQSAVASTRCSIRRR